MRLLVCLGLGEEGDAVNTVEGDPPMAGVNHAVQCETDASGVSLGRYQLTLVERSRVQVTTLQEGLLI